MARCSRCDLLKQPSSVYPPSVMTVRRLSIDSALTSASMASRGITPGTGDKAGDRGRLLGTSDRERERGAGGSDDGVRGRTFSGCWFDRTRSPSASPGAGGAESGKSRDLRRTVSLVG